VYIKTITIIEFGTIRGDCFLFFRFMAFRKRVSSYDIITGTRLFLPTAAMLARHQPSGLLPLYRHTTFDVNRRRISFPFFSVIPPAFPPPEYRTVFIVNYPRFGEQLQRYLDLYIHINVSPVRFCTFDFGISIFVTRKYNREHLS